MAIQSASKSPFATVEAIPTGLPALDKILGIGGVPKRRITEISGPWSAGKTTLALMTVANAQREGIKCVWADIEWSFDLRYAQHLGVDLDELGMIQEEFAEAALEELVDFAAKEEGCLFVIDAVGALQPRVDAEKEMGGKTIGAQANIVSKFCRKIVPILAMRNHALIVLNHEFLDIMNHGKVKTSGGAKLEYHKSIWVKLWKTSKFLTQGENKIGEVIGAEIRKNKLAATVKQQCELHMLFGHGFSVEADKLQQLLDAGTVVKKGRFFYIGDNRVANSAAEMREYLKIHADEFNQ